jgi:hypothetical protein
MLSIFRPVIDRLKALFAATAAQELEAEAVGRDAERRAELLRLAERYDREGLPSVARKLRNQAESSNLEEPLAIALPLVRHLFDDQEAQDHKPKSDATPALPGIERVALPAPKKPKRRKP